MRKMFGEGNYSFELEKKNGVGKYHGKRKIVAD